MTINFIACVANYKNKLGIGRNNGLLFKIKEDLQFFKNITTNQLSDKSNLQKNVVVMGRKTWYSIPTSHRPLNNRVNIVLTNDKQLRRISPFPWKAVLSVGKKSMFNVAEIFDKDVYYWTFSEFQRFYKLTNANVFVVGGGEIYKQFLEHTTLSPENVYLTEVTEKKWDNRLEPDTFMEPLDARYKLTGVSDKKVDPQSKANYRFLTYKRMDARTQGRTDEMEYLTLCQNVLLEGKERDDRTGVGTISVFGRQLHFDISQSIPLMTTKRVPWKHVIQELLWFMRGDTDAKILQKQGVKIWDGNTSRDFLDQRGLHHYPEGVLGAGYGWQWRFFGAKYCHAFADTSELDTTKISGFDQLDYIVNELKNNPYGRRALMCYWNPPDFEKTALLPCHYSCQFYVDYKNGEPFLDCHFTMRSTDVFLGLPFNIFSYATLTYIITLKCDMKPGKLVYTGADVHIYQNHAEQVKEQLSRSLRPLPRLIVNKDVKYKDFGDITIADFDIAGYFPHAPIKAPMAV